MTNTNYSFRSDQEDDLSSYGSVSPGEYPVETISCEIKQTKAGMATGVGLMFEITQKILAPEDVKGTMMTFRLNIENSNPKAQGIGRSQLKNLSQSSGIPDWDDARQLIGRKMMAKLKLIEATELYPEKNDIVRWNKMETADDMPFQNEEPQTAPQTSPAPAPSLPPVGNTQAPPEPWKQREQVNA